ncbi:MAG: GntR family transcriptional regulator [Cyclobacteriaceae bacterium]
MPTAIEHSDLSGPVYARVKAMIEKGELKPGEKLVQEKLANTLGVSRTPLLKALQQLEHEMLVESIPRRGMYVKSVSLQEMINVYDCREAVETMAVRLLIERASDKEKEKFANIFESFDHNKIDPKKYGQADEKFHDMLIDLSKNPLLKKMSSLSNIHKQVYQYGLIRTPEQTLKEHLAIVDAVKQGDGSLAEREVRNHINLSRNVLIELQKQKNT